jgi:hypothetical protein
MCGIDTQKKKIRQTCNQKWSKRLEERSDFERQNLRGQPASSVHILKRQVTGSDTKIRSC